MQGKIDSGNTSGISTLIARHGKIVIGIKKDKE
jgi:hypothetical protein